MNTLSANIANEMEKTFHKKKTLALLLVTALIPVGTAMLLFLFKSKVGFLGLGATDFPILILGLFTNLFLPLFVFMWAADSFAGEAGERTLKLTLFRPITRIKVFTSKIIAIGLSIGIFLAILFILSLAAGMFLGDAGSGWRAGFFNGIKAYSLAVLPMLALGIAAAFIAQFFRNSSGALTTSIFVYIAAKLLPLIVPQSAKLLLVSYTDWHMLWLGPVSPEKLLYSFLFILSSGIIFFSAGCYLFDTKEL
ncbi:MAG: ABC transporter permease [Eubacteriales bacterium]